MDNRIILKRQEWILTIIDKIPDIDKKTWIYVLITPDEKYTLVDYDTHQARMYVKNLLAKMNKLLEVRMLWRIIIFWGLTLISIIGLIIWNLILSRNVLLSVKNAQTEITTFCTTKQRITEQTNKNFEDLDYWYKNNVSTWIINNNSMIWIPTTGQ